MIQSIFPHVCNLLLTVHFQNQRDIIIKALLNTGITAKLFTCTSRAAAIGISVRMMKPVSIYFLLREE